MYLLGQIDPTGGNGRISHEDFTNLMWSSNTTYINLYDYYIDLINNATQLFDESPILSNICIIILNAIIL